MKFAALAAGLAGLSLFATGAAATNYVGDGNFSSPYGGGGYTTYGGGSSMGPWTVTGNSVDLIGGYWQSPTPGLTGSVDLDGSAPGGLTQTLALGPGAYALTFDLSGNPDNAAFPDHTVDVSVGGASASYTFDTVTAGNTHGDMGYVLETLDFTTSGPTTLSFTSADASNSPYGPVIGNVSVTGVPETTTWCLMILGIGGMGVALRARRQLAVI